MASRKAQLAPGARVRMSERLKSALCRNGCWAHVAEFGSCAGAIIGWDGPDVRVRWEPSGLCYTYLPKDLIPSCNG